MRDIQTDRHQSRMRKFVDIRKKSSKFRIDDVGFVVPVLSHLSHGGLGFRRALNLSLPMLRHHEVHSRILPHGKEWSGVKPGLITGAVVLL